jgi:hypothetical protein
VRPNNTGFEIVAGARRYRAAQLAELFSIPARIVDIDDAQALEWQLIELSIVVKRFLFVYAGCAFGSVTASRPYAASSCSLRSRLPSSNDLMRRRSVATIRSWESR